MPKVSLEYLQKRREEIIDAAAACMARNGVHRTTLSDIRAEADVSNGALYHYFKSKDEIIAAIRERSLALDSVARSDAEASRSAREALSDMVEQGMASNHGSPANRDARLAIMLWAEALTNPEVHKGQIALVQPWRDAAECLIDQAIEDGELDPNVDHAVLVDVLATFSLGATVLTAWQPRRIKITDMLSTARQLIDGNLWTEPTRNNG